MIPKSIKNELDKIRPNTKDDQYVGKKFGMLNVLEYFESDSSYRSKYLCVCDCGNIRVVYGCHLKSGLSESCGCVAKRKVGDRMRKHGMFGTRFYKTWGGLLYRCRNNHKYYEHVSVCKRWEKFENFMDDMFVSYNKHAKKHGEKNTTIDRVDPHGIYSPQNCRWATYKVQANNKRKKA